MTHEALKLGKMGSHNKKLRAHTGGGEAYVPMGLLNRLALSHPEDYIKRLETAARLAAKGPAFADSGEYLLISEVILQEGAASSLWRIVNTARFIRAKNAVDWTLLEITEKLEAIS